jgi:hypothetical protein
METRVSLGFGAEFDKNSTHPVVFLRATCTRAVDVNNLPKVNLYSNGTETRSIFEVHDREHSYPVVTPKDSTEKKVIYLRFLFAIQLLYFLRFQSVHLVKNSLWLVPVTTDVTQKQNDFKSLGLFCSVTQDTSMLGFPPSSIRSVENDI